jgi:hypothetical protein
VANLGCGQAAIAGLTYIIYPISVVAMAPSAKPSQLRQREPLLRRNGTMDESNGGLDSKHVTTDTDESKKKEKNLRSMSKLFRADEDAFVQPTTTRKELWSYYLYYKVNYVQHFTM